MPTASVYVDQLHAAIGEMSEHDFDELCFQFGLELDEVTSEFQIAAKEKGVAAAEKEGLSDRHIYKIDVPANRCDLLCVEGITRALQIFRGRADVPQYVLKPATPVAEHRLTVNKSVCGIRDYVVCAALRNVAFTEDSYKSFIDLQDKLHHNICRKRTLASMGTHDMDALEGPFTYEALAPQEINFVPLKENRSFRADQLMKHYQEHQQLKQFLHIIRDKPRFPVVLDAQRRVMSLPPIINSEFSKITLDTKNVFIEITAEDHTKANNALNTLVCMFSEYCADKFTVEPVEVVYEADYVSCTFAKAGDVKVYPRLEPNVVQSSCSSLKQNLRLDGLLDSKDIPALLSKMCVPARVGADGDSLEVDVPVTRSDVMHECDLVEDLGIAYGFNNLVAEEPAVLTKPVVQMVNKLSDMIRHELAAAGFSEGLTWGLVSVPEAFGRFGKDPSAAADGASLTDGAYSMTARPVRLANPKTKEFEVVRTSLIPGLLKTVAYNKMNAPPINMFEVSDVVLADSSTETGARNERRVAAIHAGMTAGFDKVHGLLDQLMLKLNAVPAASNTKLKEKRDLHYRLEAHDDNDTFVPGQQARVVIRDRVIGLIGVLHPRVLAAFEVALPATVVEFNLEPFLEWL